MQFPWVKARAERAQLVSRLERAELEATAVREVLGEVSRVIASSPAPGWAQVGLAPNAGYPLYQYDQPIRYSTPQSPRKNPDSQVTLQTMRQIADTYDVLRSCIQHLKREVSAVPMEIVPREKDADPEKYAAKIKRGEQFFAPHGGLGGRGRRRSQYEGMWIEDVLVTGASASYYHPTRGGGLYEVLPIDAATIRPVVDAFGWPGPGEARYEQWVYDVQVRAFTEDEMTYDGLWPVTYTPYFKGAVEWILAPATTAMKADEWNRLWLTDGNTPDDLIAAPEAWSPEQIERFYEWFNSLVSGNMSERVKTKIVPGGTQRVQGNSRRDQAFPELELWLLRRTCSIMGVQPASIGYVGDQYKSTEDASFDQTSAFGAGQLLEFRKARYDEILTRLGLEDLEVVNVVAREEAASERADRLTKLVDGAILTPNEARQIEGKDNIEGADTLLISSQYVPLDQWVAQQQNETEMQHKQLAAPDQGAGQGDQGAGGKSDGKAQLDEDDATPIPFGRLYRGRL